MSVLTELFLTFAKIGLFTFGGGYAMISIIEDNCVEKKKWISHEDMMELTVIAESTPGPIAINMATSVGYRQAGISGAIAATIGVVLPSFVIIYLISNVLDNFLEIPVTASAFKGIKVGVGILILNAGINMVKNMKKKAFPMVVTACSCMVMLAVNFFSVRVSSITVMLIAGLVSLALFFREGGKAA